MKRITLTIIAIIISTSFLLAQHDLKLNISGLLFHEYGIGYEYVLTDEITTAVYTSFSDYQNFIQNSYITSNENYKYKKLSISPELRFYIKYKHGADNFFFSLYFRYEIMDFNNLIHTNDMGKEIIYDANYQNLGLGVLAGKKWMSNYGIYVEVLAGVGKFIHSNTSISNMEVEDSFSKQNSLESFNYLSFDLRLQIALGYRFGGE